VRRAAAEAESHARLLLEQADELERAEHAEAERRAELHAIEVRHREELAHDARRLRLKAQAQAEAERQRVEAAAEAERQRIEAEAEAERQRIETLAANERRRVALEQLRIEMEAAAVARFDFGERIPCAVEEAVATSAGIGACGGSGSVDATSSTSSSTSTGRITAAENEAGVELASMSDEQRARFPDAPEFRHAIAGAWTLRSSGGCYPNAATWRENEQVCGCAYRNEFAQFHACVYSCMFDVHFPGLFWTPYDLPCTLAPSFAFAGLARGL
jgi:hypothetical protein